MFGEVLTLLHQLIDNSLCLTTMLFPYAPTPANRRRDKTHAKLSELFCRDREVTQERHHSSRGRHIAELD